MRRDKGFVIILLPIILLLVVGVLGFMYLKQNPSPRVSENPILYVTPSPVGTNSQTSDFPPLYPGVKWEEVKQEEILVIEKNGKSIDSQGYYRESIALNSITDYVNFYKDKLKALGWEQVSYASGPNGEVISYMKLGKHITVGHKPKTDGEYGYLIYD